MYTTIYKCKVITPMFIHGANKKTPELRAPSIKGAMRFWWRAANISSNQDNIRKREDIIFGGTNNTPMKSSFSIHVEMDKQKTYKDKYSPIPHTDCTFRVSCFQINTEFTVYFHVNNKVINKIKDSGEIEYICGKERLEEIENIFELMALCGGLGMRSRRGFGAFSIIKKNEENYNKEITSDYIRDLIYSVREEKIPSINESNENKVICDFNQFKTGLISVQLADYNHNIEKLPEHIGKRLYNVRKTNNYKAKDIDNALGHIGNGRLASPVIVSAIMVNDTEYNIIITTLCSINHSEKNYTEKNRCIQAIQDKYITSLI